MRACVRACVRVRYEKLFRDYAQLLPVHAGFVQSNPAPSLRQRLRARAERLRTASRRSRRSSRHQQRHGGGGGSSSSSSSATSAVAAADAQADRDIAEAVAAAADLASDASTTAFIPRELERVQLSAAAYEPLQANTAANKADWVPVRNLAAVFPSVFNRSLFHAKKKADLTTWRDWADRNHQSFVSHQKYLCRKLVALVVTLHQRGITLGALSPDTLWTDPKNPDQVRRLPALFALPTLSALPTLRFLRARLCISVSVCARSHACVGTLVWVLEYLVGCLPVCQLRKQTLG